jgi:hypothetical protein
MPKGRKSKRSFVRPGEPTQKTKRGLEIPVPEREEFFRTLGNAAKKRPASAPRGKAKP